MNMTTHSISQEQQLSVAIAELRSADTSTQNKGIEKTIQLGSTAVPELIKLLNTATTNHSQAMFALSQIADKQAASAFTKGLSHHNEWVRTFAAQGLARINHPEAFSACLQTLNDGSDELHLDMTPSVTALAAMGLIAVPALLDRMMDKDEISRLHAQRSLELFINQRHGFSAGQGFPSKTDEAAARAEWQAHGNYDYNADEATREAAIAKWQQWLDVVTESSRETP